MIEFGYVVDRNDPEKLDRVRIRIDRLHSSLIKDEDLPWSQIMFPVNAASNGGVGSSHQLLKGTTVVGCFIDGTDMQNFFIMGTVKGKPEDRELDPDGINPKIINESDASRLARNEKISETVIGEVRRNKEVFPNIGNRKWNEPEPMYNASYPYNFVYEFEDGSVIENDSTPGSERYHFNHKPSKNYVEIDRSGRKVEKIYGDDYQIVKKDRFIYVDGDCHITVRGNVNQRIFGDKIEEIDGDFKKHVKGNYELIVEKRMRTFVKEKMYIVVRGITHFWSKIIDMNNWRRRRPQHEEIR